MASFCENRTHDQTPQTDSIDVIGVSPLRKRVKCAILCRKPRLGRDDRNYTVPYYSCSWGRQNID